MPVLGQGLVAIWHGLEPGWEPEYQAWHTREHMPERLGIPGFLRGRRYVNWALDKHPTFTLYEGAHVETFRSPGYIARLNAPTPWSNAVQPHMTNFLRGGCETLLSLGRGTGGAVATIRLTAPEGATSFEGDAMAAALRLLEAPGVTGAAFARHEAQVTGDETAETRMRPSVDRGGFSHLLLVEGLSVAALEKAGLSARLEALRASVSTGLYALDFELRSPIA